VKGHICIGTRTNCICSCEVTYGNLSDVRQAPRLLEQINGKFNVKEVSADKAYNAYKIFQIIEEMKATPYIPFLSSRNPKKETSPKIWYDMYQHFQNHREDFMKHYHRRSNVETVFAMVKLRLGEFLKCKNYEAQRCELLMKFIVHNITVLIQEIFENDLDVEFRDHLKAFLNSNGTLCSS